MYFRLIKDKTDFIVLTLNSDRAITQTRKTNPNQTKMTFPSLVFFCWNWFTLKNNKSWWFLYLCITQPTTNLNINIIILFPEIICKGLLLHSNYAWVFFRVLYLWIVWIGTTIVIKLKMQTHRRKCLHKRKWQPSLSMVKWKKCKPLCCDISSFTKSNKCPIKQSVIKILISKYLVCFYSKSNFLL